MYKRKDIKILSEKDKFKNKLNKGLKDNSYENIKNIVEGNEENNIIKNTTEKPKNSFINNIFKNHKDK